MREKKRPLPAPHRERVKVRKGTTVSASFFNAKKKTGAAAGAGRLSSEEEGSNGNCGQRGRKKAPKPSRRHPGKLGPPGDSPWPKGPRLSITRELDLKEEGRDLWREGVWSERRGEECGDIFYGGRVFDGH